nr:DUF222 domain-containing protein [Aquihabitans sp. G128]
MDHATADPARDAFVGDQDGFEAAVAGVQTAVAELMGVTNACYGRLVELVGEALDGELWNGWGIQSASHWLAWQTGLSPARAEGLVRVAERREELPCAVAALAAGELCVDAVVAIAKGAPAAYEASITEFAKAATLQQLRKCLRGYTYDPDTEAARAKAKRAAAQRSVSTGTDDDGWWLHARLPADEGAVVEQALAVARDQLWDQERAATPEGGRPATVSFADALVGAAEGFLRAGEAAHPGSGRFQVLLHLEAAPDGTAGGEPVAAPGTGAAVHAAPAVDLLLRADPGVGAPRHPVERRAGPTGPRPQAAPPGRAPRRRLPGARLRTARRHRDPPHRALGGRRRHRHRKPGLLVPSPPPTAPPRRPGHHRQRRHTRR